MKRFSWLFVILAPLLFLCTLPWLSGSAESYHVRPSKHVTLILVDNLTVRDLTECSAFRNLIGSTYTLGLVSPGLPRRPGPKANLYATLSAGDVVNAQNPRAGLLDRIVAEPANKSRIRIVRFGDAGLPGKLNQLARLMPKIDPHEQIADIGTLGERTIVVGVTPPYVNDYWRTLTPILYPATRFDMNKGAGFTRLTSATTQTPDLIALRDVAPTVLHEAGLPIPAEMSGSHAQIESIKWQWPREPWAYVKRMESLTELNQDILLWMAWTYGIVSGIAVLGSLAGALGYLPRQKNAIRYLVRYLFACPVALLFAPLPLWFGWMPMTLLAYGMLTAVIPLAVALLSVRQICMLTALVLIADGLSGTHLVSMSSLSGYWLSGIRFYGIGNEYMGVLVGMGLVASLRFAGAEGEQLPKGAAWALALWFAAIVFVLSFPAFGAKAGGAIVALAAFVPAWLGLVKRNPLRWPVFACSALAGFALIFAWTAIANKLGVRHTHIQAAATAAAHGRIGYIWHIALRKAKLAVRTVLVPGVIATLVGMVPVIWIWNHTRLKRQAREFLATRPKLGAVMRAGIGATVPTLLFNDSGVVAIVFLFGAVAMNLLYEMLGETCESSPSMSAMSVSASL